jgi:hypothetical protein
VLAVGQYTFYKCASLTTADFPKAETIGKSAFISCAKLATVNLPAAETIGEWAFAACPSLTTVTLTAVKEIGQIAFGTLTSSSKTVTMLCRVYLPAEAPRLDIQMFSGFTDAANCEFQVIVPQGTDAYGSEWEQGFRGAGWDGEKIINADPALVNKNVRVQISHATAK